MAKKKLIDVAGGELKSSTPKVKAVRPYGSTILVEMLNAEEALGTGLALAKGTSIGAPQAYILAFGSRVNPEEAGVKIGDRVMLQGTYVPVVNFDHSDRQKGIVEIHNIKAVIEEESASSIIVS